MGDLPAYCFKVPGYFMVEAALHIEYREVAPILERSYSGQGEKLPRLQPEITHPDL